MLVILIPVTRWDLGSALISVLVSLCGPCPSVPVSSSVMP